MIRKITDTKPIQHLFENWEETLIWSCLQGVMGEVCGTDDGLAAMAVIGDFIFFAGNANEKLISYKSESCQKDFVIMVPQNEEWALMIEQHYKEKAKKISRYAIKKEPDVFDIDKLTQAVQDLPEEYTLKMIEICGYRREQDELFNNI